MPINLHCNFTVAATNGLGVTGLVGAYVQNVFMHTSTTPATGNSNPGSPNIAIVNPNPAAGTILIQLQDEYSGVYSVNCDIQSPTSGSALKIDNAALTPGIAYIISTVGDASLATWQGVGLPKGITPAVGVSFIATSAGGSTNTSTSRVMATALGGSGIFMIEKVGNLNLTVAPSPSANQGFGSQLILQCRNASGTLTNPTDGSVISISMLLSNSSVKVGGE
jgi:hypothetical protein